MRPLRCEVSGRSTRAKTEISALLLATCHLFSVGLGVETERSCGLPVRLEGGEACCPLKRKGHASLEKAKFPFASSWTLRSFPHL